MTERSEESLKWEVAAAFQHHGQRNEPNCFKKKVSNQHENSSEQVYKTDKTADGKVEKVFRVLTIFCRSLPAAWKQMEKDGERTGGGLVVAAQSTKLYSSVGKNGVCVSAEQGALRVTFS